MTSALNFRAHQSFQRSVLLTVAAAAGAGALLWASTAAGWGLWPAAALGALAFSMAVSRSAGDDARRQRWNIGFRALLLLVGVASLVTLEGTSARIGLAVSVGAAFAIDRRGWHGLFAALVGGFGAVVAVEVGLRILTSAQFASMPSVATTALAGAGLGLAMAVPLAVRHLELARDPISTRFHEVHPVTTGEVRELIERGYQVWTQVSHLSESDDNRGLLEEAVLRLFDTAQQWSQTSANSDATSESSLRERMLRLEERIEASSDAQARGEYEQARSAISEQLRYLDGMRTSRERVVARLHNYLAAMERLRLALVSAQSSRSAADVAPVASTLEEIGRDLENESL